MVCGGGRDVVLDLGFGARRTGGDPGVARPGEGEGDDVAFGALHPPGSAGVQGVGLSGLPVDDFDNRMTADFRWGTGAQPLHDAGDFPAALRALPHGGFLDLPEVAVLAVDVVQVIPEGASPGLEPGRACREEDCGGGGVFVPDKRAGQVAVALFGAEDELGVGGMFFDDFTDVLETDQEIVYDFDAEGAGDEAGEVGGDDGFCDQPPGRKVVPVPFLLEHVVAEEGADLVAV